MQTSGPTSDEFDDAIAELDNSYMYFDNQTIGDLLAKAPSDPELITHFNNRIDVLHEITPVVVAELHLGGHAARSLHRGPDRSRLRR